MLPPGDILLHEYTHSESLVVPPLQQEAVDVTPTSRFGYGTVQIEAIASQPFSPTISNSFPKPDDVRRGALLERR